MEGKALLASRKQRPGMLLKLYNAQDSPMTKNFLAKMPVVPRLRKSS